LDLNPLFSVQVGGKERRCLLSIPMEFDHAPAAAYAILFLLNDREEEDRLVLVDYEGKEWPW